MIGHQGDALIVRINLQVIIFLAYTAMEKIGHLDTFMSYNTNKIISFSTFGPHPPITTTCVGCCSVSLSL